MRLRIAAVLLVLLSLMFLLVGCGSQKTSPKFVANEQPSSDTYALKPSAYVLTPDERPDFEKMVLLQTAPFLNDGALWSSADGFVKRLSVRLGTKQVYAQELGGEGVAAKFTLFGSDDTVLYYFWLVNGDEYSAFADGPIWHTGWYKVEVLALEPYNNRVRISFTYGANNVLVDKAGVPASREFTITGGKPDESTVEPHE